MRTAFHCPACNGPVRIYSVHRPRPDRVTRYARCRSCGARLANDELTVAAGGEVLIRRRTRATAPAAANP